MPSAQPKQVRGQRVVEKILEAAIEEMSDRGYGAMSFEAVAERAGVAKTTIYRRWPLKSDLAIDALRRVGDSVLVSPDTGALRSDLLAMLRSFRDFITSPRGKSLMRMVHAEAENPDIARMAKTMSDEKESEPLAVIERAVKRGELPRGTDAHIVLETLFGRCNTASRSCTRRPTIAASRSSSTSCSSAPSAAAPAPPAPSNADPRRFDAHRPAGGGARLAAWARSRRRTNLVSPFHLAVARETNGAAPTRSSAGPSRRRRPCAGS